MRDYDVMRQVLAVIAASGETRYSAFGSVKPRGGVDEELSRLTGDGLVDGEVMRDRYGTLVGVTIRGLTDEGVEFWRLIENDDVWRIVLGTLTRAAVDVSYPLLKEVCEEIVKRYVTRFIPDL